MSVSLSDRVSVAGHVVFRDLDDEAVLLDLRSGVYFGLDPVGTRVWHLLGRHAPLSAVRDALVDEYDVTAAACTADLLRFVDQLAASGLVELRDA